MENGGTCELGYFSSNRPLGKYQKFLANGECVDEGLREEGSILIKRFSSIESFLTPYMGVTSQTQVVKSKSVKTPNKVFFEPVHLNLKTDHMRSSVPITQKMVLVETVDEITGE